MAQWLTWERMPVAVLLSELQEVRAEQVTGPGRLVWLGVVAIVLAIVGLGVVLFGGFAGDAEWLLIIGSFAGFGLMVALIAVLSWRGKVRRRAVRVKLVSDVLDALRWELHGRGRVELRLDLTPPVSKTKCVRTGTSMHGNPKAWYRDPWCELRARLADGSTLVVKQVDKVKTRKGGVQKHKRILTVRLRPSSRSYAGVATSVRPDDVERTVLLGINTIFEDKPEGLKAVARQQEGIVGVRVMQLDHDYTGAEVRAVVEVLLDLIRDCRRT